VSRKLSAALQLSTIRNEYRPRCGDALWLGSKGNYGSFHLCIKCVGGIKLCDPLLASAIPEHLRDEYHIKSERFRG